MDYGSNQPYADDSAGYGGQQTGYSDQQSGYSDQQQTGYSDQQSGYGGQQTGYGNDNMGYGDDTSHGYNNSSLRKEEVTSVSVHFIASFLYPPIHPLKSP